LKPLTLRLFEARLRFERNGRRADDRWIDGAGRAWLRAAGVPQERVFVHGYAAVGRSGAGSFSEQFALLFRDFMRAHPDAATEYADLKMMLARRYSGVKGRPAYTEAKGPFIWEIMARADAWAQRTGWMPGPTDA